MEIVKWKVAFNHSLRPRLHGYVFKSFRFHFVAFSNQSTLDCVFKYVAFSWSFSSFPCKQEVKPWKRIPVTGALGPVTISLRFHLLFTRKRWRRLWKRKPNWISLKTQWYDFKRNNLKMHPCNRDLSWRQVCYKNLIYYIILYYIILYYIILYYIILYYIIL